MTRLHEDPHVEAPVNLRLLVVAHTYVERANRQKWFALGELVPEWDITVLTPDLWHDSDFGSIISVPETCGRVRFVTLRTIGSTAGTYVFIDPSLVALMRSTRPDLIYVEAEPWSAVYLQVTALALVVARQARCAVFSWWNTRRWTTPLSFPGSLCYRIGLKRTSLLVAGNPGAAELHAQEGFQGPIVIVPQVGVDLSLERPDEDRVAARTRHGLVSDFVIGFVGRLRERKGVTVLLRAVAGLQNPHWDLLFVGDGPSKQHLMDEASALGIADRVHYTGALHRSRIAEHIRLMDVLVLPSLEEQWEQFGHVLIEAMACNVVVLGSNSGEIPWVIGDSRLISPMGDVTALRSRLEALRADPQAAAMFRANGLAMVNSTYSHVALAKKLRTAFTDAVANIPAGVRTGDLA